MYFVVARVIHTVEGIQSNEIDVDLYPQGYIVSHQGYNNNDYESNINSSLKLVNINYQNFTLEFKSWNLQDQSCFDYLVISYRTSRVQLCDVSRPLTMFIYNETKALLTFITDDVKEDKGFILLYNGEYVFKYR